MSRSDSTGAVFPHGWFGPALRGYREAPATYGYDDYNALPPLEEEFDGSLAWLTPIDDLVAREMQPHWEHARRRSKLAMNFERIVAEAMQHGYKVPETFLQFMRSEALQKRIPSCTACYFDAPERIVDAPAPGAGILIRFMNDQQWCVVWHLYIDRHQSHAIVASPRAFDVEDDLDLPEANEEESQLVMCAPDFETFLYRFWLENSAWFALEMKHRPLTQREKGYLAYYAHC